MQRDSKQIQVDLQDLGYETCGRSENEAEREDTSSPGLMGLICSFTALVLTPGGSKHTQTEQFTPRMNKPQIYKYIYRLSVNVQHYFKH